MLLHKFQRGIRAGEPIGSAFGRNRIMMTKTNEPYTDAELAVLVEGYIIQQRSEWTLKVLYSYIV